MWLSIEVHQKWSQYVWLLTYVMKLTLVAVVVSCLSMCCIHWVGYDNIGCLPSFTLQQLLAHPLTLRTWDLVVLKPTLYTLQRKLLRTPVYLRWWMGTELKTIIVISVIKQRVPLGFWRKLQWSWTLDLCFVLCFESINKDSIMLIICVLHIL